MLVTKKRRAATPRKPAKPKVFCREGHLVPAGRDPMDCSTCREREYQRLTYIAEKEAEAERRAFSPASVPNFVTITITSTGQVKTFKCPPKKPATRRRRR